MILVDPRVGSAQYKQLIQDRVNCPVRFAKPRLRGGDICFEGNGPDGMLMVGIELKTVGDMLGSMRSGRLAGKQLIKMHRDYQIHYVIVEGQYKPDKQGNITVPRFINGKSQWVPLTLGKLKAGFRYAELDKFMISLENKKNVCVSHTRDEIETTWQIVNRYTWWQEDWDAHQSTDAIKHQDFVSYTQISLLRDIASRLPGIGWGRSKEVEQAFINVLQMVLATEESWKTIDGIGPTLAAKVFNALREVR